MTPGTIRAGAYAMPFTSPAWPRGPYRYVGRETFTIAYRSDAAAVAQAVPEPLRPAGDEARLVFTAMPDSTGFGRYHMCTQSIPVTLPDGEAASYLRFMFVDAHPPSAGGRELWGFPQKLARPGLSAEHDTLVGHLDHGAIRVASGSMGFKHAALDAAAGRQAIATPGVTLKIMPHVDGTPRICELVRFAFTDISVTGAWAGPAALSLHPHALAPLASLPVREVLWASHVVADMTLPLGRRIHDYLGARA